MRLLEREDELGVLAGAVARATEGEGGVVLVGGEAGIGKTTLVRALRRQLGDHVAFLSAACEALSVPVPLAPVRELFELADASEPERDDRFTWASALLRALASRAPAVVVIEDAHWADPLTLDLIRLAARRIERIAVAMLVTYRDDELAANRELERLVGDLATGPAVRRVTLRRLSRAAVAELADPVGLDVHELSRLTGGNPFLVVESVAAGGRLPGSVRDAALARAGRLDAAARTAVEVAAVIGQRFDPSLLSSVAPEADAAAIDQALERGVLVADGAALAFRHELIREAIEASISPRRRAEIHGRVTTALAAQAGPVDSARLAHHAELGGLSADACRYAVAAAAEAERIGAVRELRLQAERALRLGDSLEPEERFELLLKHSRGANFASTRLEEALHSAEQAAALADQLGDPVKRGTAHGLLAAALWSLDRVSEAKAAAERAVLLLDTTDDVAGRARALATLVRMEASACDPSAALKAGQRAVTLARASGLEEVQTDVEISLALAQGHQGDEQALGRLLDAAGSARDKGFTIPAIRAYVNAVFLAVMLRRHTFVDTQAREALALFSDYGTTIPANAIELYRARSMLDRGRWDAARATAARTDRDWVAETATARAIEGLVAARIGEPGATGLLERGWQEIRDVSEGSRHGMLRLAVIEGAWLAGDHPTAIAHLQAARASSATARFARAGAELSLWGWRYGVELEPPRGSPAPVLFELAGDWRGAMRAWRECDAPYEAALAALPGDDRAAREALAVLHRLGARAAARAFVRAREASGAGSSRGPRRSTLANPAGLTRREQEVLAAMATGATNAAIAASLHLSVRTVAHHVTAILSKLGAANRVVAIERARDKGLLPQDGNTPAPT